MRVRNSSQGYGAVAMALHWLVVVLVIGAWFTGQSVDSLPRGPQRDTGMFVHITLGLSILASVAARLSWRLTDPPPAPEEAAFGRWGEWAGQAAHYIMYALLVAAPAVGIVAVFARGRGLPVFGLFEIASPWAADRNFAHNVTEVHETLANGLMILVGLHAAAALVHHYVMRDRTLLRMLPGRRS
jgi:cytochrome b561